MFFLIDIATVIVEMIFISIYLKGLFQNYEVKRLLILSAFVVVGIGSCVLSILPVNPFLRLGFYFVAIFMLAKVLFKIKWLTASFSAMLLCIIYIIVDIIGAGVIGLLGVPIDLLFEFTNYRILYIVFGKLIQAFCIYVVIKLSPWKKSQESLQEAIPLLFCQVFSVVIIYFMYLETFKYHEDVTIVLVLGCVGILYINIVIFLSIERIKKISEIKKQNELAEQLYQSKLDYFNQVKDDQEETRALWHDIQKYLNTMTELVQANDLSNAQECIEQVTELFTATGNVVDVGNTVVNAVLNHSVQKARRDAIDVNLDIRIRQEINISAADLSVIIGNTFDNAIEACSLLPKEQREITIQLIQKENILFYEISNQFDSMLYAPIKEKPFRGYGLKNVRRSVSKYNGVVNVDEKNEKYIVTIDLNIPVEARRVSA